MPCGKPGGLPNQFIGDSVMAIFGIGQDIPNPPRARAVAAAQGIRKRPW